MSTTFILPLPDSAPACAISPSGASPPSFSFTWSYWSVVASNSWLTITAMPGLLPGCLTAPCRCWSPSHSRILSKRLYLSDSGAGDRAEVFDRFNQLPGSQPERDPEVRRQQIVFLDAVVEAIHQPPDRGCLAGPIDRGSGFG